MQARFRATCPQCRLTINVGDEIKRDIYGQWVHKEHVSQVDSCRHQYEFSSYCGADVCVLCGDHKGLGSCFCGWNGARSDPEARYQEEWGW
jgi:hypothetical protein